MILWNSFEKFVFLVSCGALSLLGLGCSSEPTQVPANFQLFDPNLRLDLISEQPDIVTPIGLAIDQEDALFVLESHTHSPPAHYQGPKFDRIKKGVDENGDGTPDKWLVFADSIMNGNNLAIDPAGRILVTEKKRLLAFWDDDNDGQSDGKAILLHMPAPDYVYDHAGILGVAVGPNGWIYLSMGNVGGKAWKIMGAEGQFLEGYGDGGIVLRCKLDGSQLEMLASGFWNPFGLNFNHEGRLFVTDNDPDSRGPNRLLEIVPGGRYGYKSLYGGSGLHPYLAWNGELPGTLPMAAPLGEAPCALLDAHSTNFGPSYQNCVLVNIWEEKNIVKIPLSPNNGSVYGLPEVIVQGDTTFHPVAMATNSKGDLYITDWVRRAYPNHGMGRIWRLRAKQPAPLMNTSGGGNVNRFDAQPTDTAQLIESLLHADKFQTTIARHALAQPAYSEAVQSLLNKQDHPDLLIQAILILLDSRKEIEKEILVKLLHHEEVEVRKMALIYSGTLMRTDVEQELERMLFSGKIEPALFDTYLATIQHLQPEFIQNYKDRTGVTADKIKEKLPQDYIFNVIVNPEIPEETRALALPHLKDAAEQKKKLLELLGQSNEIHFTTGLMKQLQLISDPEVAEAILKIAKDQKKPAMVRSMAILALQRQPDLYCPEIKSVLSENNPLLNKASIQYLCKCTSLSGFKESIDALLDEDLNTSWNLCLNGPEPTAPEENWIKAINGAGSPALGQLVFEAPQNQCFTCHKVHGWGGTFGPDLSNIGSSKSRSQLVQAILNPSSEIAPEWQGWYVIDQDGNQHIGRQIDVHLNKAELMDLNGDFIAYPSPKAYGVLETSLMPAGLQSTMTPSDFNHLIAFLESLK